MVSSREIRSKYKYEESARYETKEYEQKLKDAVADEFGLVLNDESWKQVVAVIRAKRVLDRKLERVDEKYKIQPKFKEKFKNG